MSDSRARKAFDTACSLDVWLNPKTELPPDDKAVLLACRHKGCSSGFYYDLGWYDFFQGKWRCVADDDAVLYWAFLPKFPKDADDAAEDDESDKEE